MQFVIMHGSFGHPNEAWFPQLKTDLEALGQKVILPQMPVDDWDVFTQNGPNYPEKIQTLRSWFQTFESQVLPQLDKTQPVGFVVHSISCIFTLHIIEHFNLSLNTVIFVAPFLSKLNKSWQIDKANSSFYRQDFDFEALKNHIKSSYVLYSDNDPYVDSHNALIFAQKLNSSLIEVKGAGHMGNSSGIVNFGLVRELCQTRLFKNQ